MNKLLTAIAIGACLSFGMAHANAGPNPQQAKMAVCNKDAGDRKGEDRKVFMKECLSAHHKTLTPQQERMRACNADAGGRKGPERKAFMKECLAHHPA